MTCSLVASGFPPHSAAIVVDFISTIVSTSLLRMSPPRENFFLSHFLFPVYTSASMLAFCGSMGFSFLILKLLNFIISFSTFSLAFLIAIFLL